MSVPSSAASAMAARLSARAACRPSGSSGTARVKKPPRHRLETCSPAARTAAAASASPASATRSRHSPMAGMSCRAHSATASARLRCLTVAWFSDSRSSPIGPASRAAGHTRSGQPGEVGRHPLDGQVRLGQRPRGGGQLEHADQVPGRPLALQSGQHREVRLQAVQPGQEGHADLVVVRRRLEDRSAERDRRPHGRVVARHVALVQGRQRGGGRGGDRGERPEQGVAVAVRVPADQPGVVEVVPGVEPDPGRQPAPQRHLLARVEHRQLDAVHLPAGPLDQLEHGPGGRVEVGAAPVAAQRGVERLAQPVQDHRLVGLLQQLAVHLQVVPGAAGAGGQRAAGHQDHLRPRRLDERGLLGVGAGDLAERVVLAVGELVGPRPGGQRPGAGRTGRFGGAGRGPGDQLPGLLPGQPHAALRGVHRLGHAEPVRPQVIPEAHGRFPVDDGVSAAARRGGGGCGHMGGGEDLPSGRRRVPGRPARLGDDQRPGPRGPPGQLDLRRPQMALQTRRHLRPPAAARRAAGLRPRTAAPGWPAAPPWPLRPGPRRTAGPARRTSGTAPTPP